jgi:hypothetical protein
MSFCKKGFILSILVVFSFPGLAYSTPNWEKLQKVLKRKAQALRSANKFKIKNNTSQRNKKQKFTRKSLFDVKVSKKKINFNKIHTVLLPYDPTFPDCTHKSMIPRANNPANIITRKLNWARGYLWPKSKGRSYNRSAIDLCNKGLKSIHQAYCIDKNNVHVKSYMRSARSLCLPIYKRWWIQSVNKLEGKSVPLWAYKKATLKANVKSQMRWLEMDLKNPKKHINGMKKYLEILAMDPSNTRAQNGFDYMYAVYFGVSKALAKVARTTGNLGGKYSLLSKSSLYQLAIDELLAKHNKIEAGVPQMKLDYLGINYLLTKVYLPELEKNSGKLKKVLCSLALKKARRNFDDKSVNAELAQSSTKYCSGYGLKVTGWNFLRSPKLKFAFIEILAQHTANPQATLKDAAIHIVKQIGAKTEKICWLYENPYPESIKATAGKKAHCSSFGYAGYHNARPGFYNYVFTSNPIKKYSKLENKAAQKILNKAGAAGLAKKFKKAYKRAKGIKCLAWEVTIARAYHGRGKWGKPYRYSNGGPRKVKCSKIRRNSGLQRMFKSWNNFFDKVSGGKYTRGHWKIKRTYYRKILRKTRPAVIYVKRKY